MMMITQKQIRNFVAILLLMLLLPILANHRPLYISTGSAHFFPALTGDNILQDGDKAMNLQFDDVKVADDVFVIMPLIPWSPGRSDLMNSYAGPFSEQTVLVNGTEETLPFHYRHWLGTDGKGADVLSGILYGFRYSMLIALLAILVGGIPGIILGSIAGYFGNSGIKTTYAHITAFVIALIYFLCTLTPNVIPALIVSCILYIIITQLLKLIRITFLTSERKLAADSIIMQCMEIMVSIPALIIIITLAAIIKPSAIGLAVILGTLLWPETVRFTRGQVLQVKEQDYVLAARAMGFKDLRIIVNHILRNGITPVLILLCFSFSNVILTEAGLSFLGVGISPEIVTWGSLLASGRDNFDAWWLIIFPGVLLLCIVYYFVSLSEKFRQIHKTTFNKA